MTSQMHSMFAVAITPVHLSTSAMMRALNSAELDGPWVEVLRRKGRAVGYFLFSGEQHGFRKAETIKRCLDAELAFYAIEVFKIGLRF